MTSVAIATRTIRLYTRVEHKNLPVDVTEEVWGFTIRRKLLMHLEDGNMIEFGSMASFLSHWYGKSHNIPFARYFKIDSEEDVIVPAGIDDILSFCLPGGILWTHQRTLGIDLGAQGKMAKTLAQEVKKILFARFGRRISAMGIDPHEILQEIYKKLLTSNRGTSPFDPEKASFGHYIYLVCNSAIMNYSKKMRRRQAREQVGVSVFEGDKFVTVDVGGSSSRIAATGKLVFDPENNMANGMAVNSLCQRIGTGTEMQDLACKIVVLLQDGYTHTQLPKALGRQKREVKQAMELLQRKAKGWAVEEEIV